MTVQTVSLGRESSPVYETQFGGDSGRSPSVAVVEAIAAVEDVDVTELDPLFDDVDPEVLDQLFGQGDASASTKSLKFTVDNWTVFVRGDGSVRICDPEQSVEAAPTFGRAGDA